MHIISHAKVLQTQAQHPSCLTALDNWYRLTKRVHWQNFSQVKTCFPTVDKVGDKFVRAILTHTEYDQGDWK